MRRLFWLILLACLSALDARAQTAAPTDTTPVPLSKLEQMEATYRDSLKSRHLPLIQQYVTELRLAQTKAITAAEKTVYAEEIARIARIVNEGGIVWPVTEAPIATAATPAASERSGVVFSLDPSETNPPQPDGAEVVSLGTTTWTLSRLPAGTYELVAEYSCPEVPEGGEVQVRFDGMEEKRSLKASNATKDPATVRLMRLGRLVVKQEVLGGQITVSASPGPDAWFTVRRILIARPEKRPQESR